MKTPTRTWLWVGLAVATVWFAFTTQPVQGQLVTSPRAGSAPAQKPLNTRDLAGLVGQKGLATIELDIYPGSLLLQGMSELSVVQRTGEPANDKLLNQTLDLFAQFKSKKIKGRGTLISYEAGGSGAAYLLYLKKSDALREQVAEYAEKMVKNQKRSSEDLMTASWLPDSLDPIFIDVAFAVTPYLLYSGLALNKPDYVDKAVYQTTAMFRILGDPNGLVHQGRGFRAKGTVSQDNWSRGNGWGALALAALVRDLPKNHPQRKAVDKLAKRFFAAVLKHQNAEGLWHQEMTDTSSYVETSGSGLLLYALGVALEKNIIDKKHLADFQRGIDGLTAYVGDDGSVTHACGSCLYPGQGTKADYKKKSWFYNDPHAFGPVVLALTQAHKLGVTSLIPTRPPGSVIDREAALRKPQTYLRYMPEANGNILWENDRIAFRVYGPPAKDRVSSGIDVWTKSVSYPIIDRWYRLNAQGKEYHEDRGEGCDFFHVGFGRGNGGTAIWHNDKPYISQPYATHRILKNTADEIAFELTYAPWTVEDGSTGRFTVSERKVISMTMGTNLFKVVSTFETDRPGPLTVGIGISFANNPDIIQQRDAGLLTLWESYQPTNGELGTSVLANPAVVQGFARHQKDQFMLLTAQPGQPITYYVGAGWTKNPHVKSKQDWLTYLTAELPKLSF